MAQRCDICGKGPMTGNNISHAHNVTKRRWLPNLQRVRAMVDGKPTYNHTGSVIGYIAAYYVYPDQAATVVLLVNISHGDYVSALGYLLFEKLPPIL